MGTTYRTFGEIWTSIFEICYWTDRQTDRHTDTLGKVIIKQRIAQS